MAMAKRMNVIENYRGEKLAEVSYEELNTVNKIIPMHTIRQVLNF